MSDSVERLRVEGLFCFDDIVGILETHCDASDQEKPTRGEVFAIVESFLSQRRTTSGRCKLTIGPSDGVQIPARGYL